jgi:hypothetical protein
MTMGFGPFQGVRIMKRTAIATVALLGLFAGTAMAQKKDKAEEKKVKSYDFSGDEIDGELVKPDGDFLDTRKFSSHTSLIRIRKDFIKEIVKSAEDL